MKKIYLLIAVIFTATSTVSHAAPISPISLSGTGTFNNIISNIADGTIPSEGTHWQNSANVWWTGQAPIFTFTYDALYNVDDVLVSVDNNDSYAIEWSTDGSLWNSLFNIAVGHGEIGFGMDTMSTDDTHGEYIAALNFSSVQAQYLRIFATGGDNLYSLGEFQAFGSLANTNNTPTVPEPAPFALLVFGLIGLGILRKRKA